MSIADTISSMNTNLSNAYTACSSKSATIPTNKNLANLASTINTISGSSTLSSIAITQVGTTEYQTGETFSLNGYTVTATYSNGSALNVTNYCTFTPNRALEVTDTSVTISYIERGVSKTTTQAITVTAQIINYTTIYDNGDECSSITGGWDKWRDIPNQSFWSCFKLTKGTNRLTGTVTINKYGSLFVNNVIDLTGYVKVFNKFSYTASNSSATYFRSYFYAIDSENATAGTSIVLARKKYAGGDINNTPGTYYCINSLSELGSLGDDYYLGHGCMQEGSGTETFNYFASVLLKQDNWQQLCTVAGLTSSNYTDEANLCANATAMSTILGNQQAVIYMLYNCTGTFMAEFIKSSTALTALNNSAYKTTIQANTHWNKFLNMVA